MKPLSFVRSCSFRVSLILASALPPGGSLAAAPAPVPLTWLGQTPAPLPTGVSWGVPWPQGALPKTQAFALTAADGKALPLQTWPLAYWPDGSLKWSGFATVAGPEATGFTLAPVESAPVSGPALRVRQSDTGIEIDTGKLRARLTRWGANLIDSLTVDGREVARTGRLVCIVQHGPDGAFDEAPRRERFTGRISNLTVEQSGPVRAVVKIEGTHKAVAGSREWLPFVVRLYFHAGQESVRLVHTIIYDGDDQKDFIRGLGLEFGVPLREEIQNRHVRFSGENGGLWAEPIQPAVGRGNAIVTYPRADGSNVYPDQLAGKRIPNKAELSERSQGWLADWAVWDSFKLVQPNADGFSVVKRTNAQSAWIPCGAGRRASGLVFVGDVSGGLGVSVKNFWQSHPASLEVANATSQEATLRVWLWSPDAEPMDMRHYDTRAHGLIAVYEDVQPGLSTPLGVARTSELTLFPSAAAPSRETTVQQARLGEQLPLIVASPAYLHSVRALGLWSLPDKATPFKRAVEEQLESTLAFYQHHIEQQRWYGFWDFGDVMHSYDRERHVWNYDLGGMAWDNTELGTDMWLWLSFLRTGRADIFRMAEAMTRHTSEVDVYHTGALAGLGSRHNVRHWGCGAKEARISMAGLKRYYYYLTTDERTGDLMREVVNADATSLHLDPMRLAQPITEAEKKYPARIRVGPDWFAFVSNWMTEWERTGDAKWRDKIVAGVESLQAMPYWIKSGKNLVYGYDPKTGKLYHVSDQVGSYNLATIQGGAQVIFELNEFLGHAGWDRMWLQYCRIGSAPAEVLSRDQTSGDEGADGRYLGEQGASSQGTPRLAAYAYWKTKNAAFARPAVASLLRFGGGPIATTRVAGPLVLNPFDESARISTNGAAQSGLSAIEILELCKDQLPVEVPPPEAIPAGRGGRGGRGSGAPVPLPATPNPAASGGDVRNTRLAPAGEAPR
ncbi:exo-rhamnogalacturonan lyase family protein [Horticoccus sp. 23ND18S-11]|uniref:exo-rhamnogalacturonan lyase family protein n=1 Tax=Horticoccus sp. 23ND18S-11 TaxID=3391832 RepID=UPI0039C9682D